MFVRRLGTSLKEQHWMTIVIELVIVIVGVFIGNQVSNWNEARIEKRDTQRMLDQFVPEIDNQVAFFKSAKTYFASTQRYAAEAFAGWRRDPSVNDGQFVIAAYQASQIYGIGINAQNWALAFGAQQLRQIDDPGLRRHLSVVITADYGPVAFDQVATPYRQDVREIIPSAVQDLIRARCGDRTLFRTGASYLTMLPARCPLKLDAAQARTTAALLRSHPELVRELNWHMAAVATYLQNADGLEEQMRVLKEDIEKRR